MRAKCRDFAQLSPGVCGGVRVYVHACVRWDPMRAKRCAVTLLSSHLVCGVRVCVRAGASLESTKGNGLQPGFRAAQLAGHPN